MQVLIETTGVYRGNAKLQNPYVQLCNAVIRRALLDLYSDKTGVYKDSLDAAKFFRSSLGYSYVDILELDVDEFMKEHEKQIKLVLAYNKQRELDFG